jgi:hypothetical protein
MSNMLSASGSPFLCHHPACKPRTAELRLCAIASSLPAPGRRICYKKQENVIKV